MEKRNQMTALRLQTGEWTSEIPSLPLGECKCESFHNRHCSAAYHTGWKDNRTLSGISTIQTAVWQQHVQWNSNSTVGLSTVHHTAAEHHTETALAVLVYPQYIILQQNITQKQHWQYWSIHNTSYCSRTSHKDGNSRISLYTLQKNITQKYNNSSISVHNTYCSRSSSHKATAMAVSLSVHPQDKLHCTRSEEHHTKRQQWQY